MAMQHSDELQEAANLLFKQVQSLEIPVWSCGFNIWEKHEKICTGWMSTNDVIQPPFKIPLTESPTFIRFYKSRKKNEDFYVEKVEGNALAAHYKYMLSLPDFARIGEEQLKAGFSCRNLRSIMLPILRMAIWYLLQVNLYPMRGIFSNVLPKSLSRPIRGSSILRKQKPRHAKHRSKRVGKSQEQDDGDAQERRTQGGGERALRTIKTTGFQLRWSKHSINGPGSRGYAMVDVRLWTG